METVFEGILHVFMRQSRKGRSWVDVCACAMGGLGQLPLFEQEFLRRQVLRWQEGNCKACNFHLRTSKNEEKIGIGWF